MRLVATVLKEYRSLTHPRGLPGEPLWRSQRHHREGGFDTHSALDFIITFITIYLVVYIFT